MEAAPGQQSWPSAAEARWDGGWCRCNSNSNDCREEESPGRGEHRQEEQGEGERRWRRERDGEVTVTGKCEPRSFRRSALKAEMCHSHSAEGERRRTQTQRRATINSRT